MTKPNRHFAKSELAQTNNILNLANFNGRPLVKGFTIDSAQSLDLDDAIWVETHGEIGKIQIHIADPTEVIEIDSPIDRAVRKRISTLYLSKGIFPMLPPTLSEQKLSLLTGEAKLTITIEIDLKITGEINGVKLYESCFVSVGKLSYQEAEQISNNPEHELFLPLQLAQIWAKILNQKRVKDGAFAGIIKGDFYINEDGNLTHISCNSEVLIAEYMILANTVVARWLTEKSLTALYRNHLPQGDEEPELIWQYLESTVPRIPRSEDNKNFRSQYSHCLAKANYSPVCQGHLALATPYYLHFTSPLRRLADFIVHRIVKAELADKPNPYSEAQLKELAETINQFQLKHKQKQGDYLKEKRDKKLLKVTNYSNLDTKDFSRLIELSVRNNSLSEIKNEILTRLEAKKLTNTDLSWLLFYSKDLKLQQCIVSSFDDKGVVNFLNNCIKILEIITDLKYQEIIYNPEQLIFVSRLVITLNDRNLTTQNTVKGKNRKDAKNQAYQAWLEAYVSQELVTAAELSIIKNSINVISGESEVIEFKHQLPLSTLNNLCQQKQWQKPNFQYEKKDSIFWCTGTLQLAEQAITKIGQASKKRIAQNLAADRILIELEHLESNNLDSES